ncbi:MAG: DUF2339 domain-containing protein [Methylobacterium sp.]|nr:DUF2339 domain-containing protein [Methylobacterium sp.]
MISPVSLIALIILFAIGAAIWSFFAIIGLKARVADLESRLRIVRSQIADLQEQKPEPSPAVSEPPEQPGTISEEAGNTTVQGPAAKPVAEEAIAVASTGSVPSVKRVEPQATRTDPPPRPARDLESTLGTQWTVWVGTLALGLGGIFLVRYSIEQGFFGPRARIGSGLLFSALLAAAGEYLRRHAPDLRVPAFERAPIAALLTAAATMSAFGTVYAAHALYGLLGPGLAFAALALVALAAVLVSALHGPWLAGVGLLGAMVTPLLVESRSPDPWPVVVYLVLVAAAGYGTASLRGWAQIGRATLGGIMLWGLLIATSHVFHGAPIGFFLIAQTLLVGLAFAYRPYRDVPDGEAFIDREAHLALALMASLAVVALALHASAGPSNIAVLVALFLALAWRIPVVAGAALLACLVAVVQLLTWPALPLPQTGAGSAVLFLPLPDSVMRYSLHALLLAAGIGGIATLRLWRGTTLPRANAGLFALAGAVTPLVLLTLAWLRLRNFAVAPDFGALAGALSVAMGWLAIRFGRRSGTASAMGMEAFAAGAIAALALGLTMVLDRGYLTVALALAAAGAAWVTSRGPVNTLRVASAVLAGIVLARLAWDPAVMAGNPGSTPIFNWLLFGYGVPALAFYAAARFLRQGGDDVPLRVMEGAAILLAGLLVTFEIRHAIHGADLLRAEASHLELGLHLSTGTGFAALLMRLDPLDRNPVYRWAIILFSGVASFIAVTGLFILNNPVLGEEDVAGGAILNSLFPGYALPAIACGALYLVARSRRPAWFTLGVGSLALALAFAYVSLAVRRLFHGADIGLIRNPTSEAELWTYSAVWLALGLALLAAGLLRGSRALRLVSAGFILPTVAKVFLVDMSGLEGAWRAMSFIGLGGALIGIGLVYQRFVFRTSAKAN